MIEFDRPVNIRDFDSRELEFRVGELVDHSYKYEGYTTLFLNHDILHEGLGGLSKEWWVWMTWGLFDESGDLRVKAGAEMVRDGWREGQFLKVLDAYVQDWTKRQVEELRGKELT